MPIRRYDPVQNTPGNQRFLLQTIGRLGQSNASVILQKIAAALPDPIEFGTIEKKKYVNLGTRIVWRKGRAYSRAAQKSRLSFPVVIEAMRLANVGLAGVFQVRKYIAEERLFLYIADLRGLHAKTSVKKEKKGRKKRGVR